MLHAEGRRQGKSGTCYFEFHAGLYEQPHIASPVVARADWIAWPTTVASSAARASLELLPVQSDIYVIVPWRQRGFFFHSFSSRNTGQQWRIPSHEIGVIATFGWRGVSSPRLYDAERPQRETDEREKRKVMNHCLLSTRRDLFGALVKSSNVPKI